MDTSVKINKKAVVSLTEGNVLLGILTRSLAVCDFASCVLRVPLMATEQVVSTHPAKNMILLGVLILTVNSPTKLIKPVILHAWIFQLQ